MRHSILRAGLCLAGVLSTPTASLVAADFSWQEPHATVLPTGDIEWAPEPFAFVAGDEVSYIDFENGDDNNPGTKASPWKHHPWDPEAKGKAAQAGGERTYVFKRGVVYRGILRPDESGSAEEPIRLTSDPSWGEGEAVISGASRVTGWQQDAHPKMPASAGKVWKVDCDFATRKVAVVGSDGELTQLKLARTPNWEPQGYDIGAEWFSWEWDPKPKAVENKHLAFSEDLQELGENADYFVGGLVWSEWGIMMGTPYAAPIEGYDPKGGLMFQGPWHRASGKIMGGNRFWIEDKPHYLDEAGEFWFDKKGDGGTLYAWFLSDADPNDLHVEAAHRIGLVKGSNVEHLEISGLTFQLDAQDFDDLDKRSWQTGTVNSAAIFLKDSFSNIDIHHCRFEHVLKSIRLDTMNKPGDFHDIRITDNHIDTTDHGGMSLQDKHGAMHRVSILRNRMSKTGLRPMRPNGHNAIGISQMQTGEIAGNVLDTCYGAGIFIFGGKNSGMDHDIPMVRILIHHNKVVDAVLNTNDWGCIETWQGGPVYIYNNVAGNPVGPFHWAGRKTFSHAYYLDGAFKNHLFNNIAWGRKADPDDLWLSNMAAFQEIHSYQNDFFNNTAYKFLKGTRRQKAEPGRNKFLGNLWQDIDQVFRHTDKEGEDPNAHHAGQQGDHFAYETNAYANNVFHDIGSVFGNFEAAGGDHPSLESFETAMQVAKPLAGDVGVMADQPPLRDAEAHDFRPTPGGAAIDMGVRVYVPWSLHGTVGEWHLTRNNVDPTHLIDDHWYLAHYMTDRNTYEEAPLYPLRGEGIGAEDYQEGALEDWAPSSLELDGESQYLVCSDQVINAPYKAQVKVDRWKNKTKEVTFEGDDLRSPEIGDGNLLIEVYLKTKDDGILVQKRDGDAGYVLRIENGKAILELLHEGQVAASRTSQAVVGDGEWRHLLVEADRGTEQGLHCYVDGKPSNGSFSGSVSDYSLSNGGDLLIAGGPDLDHLACTLDFIRIARGTLEDADTTIEELYAWQFDGPHLRDFTGHAPTGEGRDAGALEHH